MSVPWIQPLSPFASERYMPPSLPRYTRFGTFGSHAMPCWSACTPPTFDHVVPPFGRHAQADVHLEQVVLVHRVDEEPAEPPLEARVRARATAGDEGRAAVRERAVAVVGDEEALVRSERLARDEVDARVVARARSRRPSVPACPTRRARSPRAAGCSSCCRSSAAGRRRASCRSAPTSRPRHASPSRCRSRRGRTRCRRTAAGTRCGGGPTASRRPDSGSRGRSRRRRRP